MMRIELGARGFGVIPKGYPDLKGVIYRIFLFRFE